MGRKRKDYSSMLIWAALVVASVRYAGAFVASDVGQVEGVVSDGLSMGMGLTGLAMGALDTLGTAYIFDGWRRALPRAGKRWPVRFRVLTGILIALFVSAVGILVPFTVSRVLHVGMDVVLAGPWLWGWAFLVNMAPYLLVGGVVVGNSGVVGVAAEPGGHKARPYEGNARRKTYVCAQCGARFVRQQGLAAHMRWCTHAKSGGVRSAEGKAGAVPLQNAGGPRNDD